MEFGTKAETAFVKNNTSEYFKKAALARGIPTTKIYKGMRSNKTKAELVRSLRANVNKSLSFAPISARPTFRAEQLADAEDDELDFELNNSMYAIGLDESMAEFGKRKYALQRKVMKLRYKEGISLKKAWKIVKGSTKKKSTKKTSSPDQRRNRRNAKKAMNLRWDRDISLKKAWKIVKKESKFGDSDTGPCPEGKEFNPNWPPA